MRPGGARWLRAAGQDRIEGLGGYTYANDLYLDDGRHEDSPLVLVGTYIQKGGDVVVK